MNKLSKALLEGKLVQRCINYIKQKFHKFIVWCDNAFGVLYRQIYAYLNPILKNKIVFVTYQGQYTCNPKYITETLLKKREGLDIVWLVDKKTILNPVASEIPENIRLVEKNTAQGLYELMTAKIWVDNALNCIWKLIPKKRKQIYLNTWHGSLGIKRLDTYDPNKGYWRYVAQKSNHCIDYMLINSTFEENVYKNSYWPDVKVKMTGHARNDMFFDSEKMRILKEKILSFYNLEEETKLLLYAPTFREDKKTECFDMDYDAVYQTLCEWSPGKWKILLRLHFHNKKSKPRTVGNDFIINATQYPDIQELMAAADVGVTDYSSWIYDYMLTRRPCFIYASDLEVYNNQRGFYYPLESTPFPIARNTDELCHNIISFDSTSYQDRLEKFLAEKGCMDDGHACERIVEIIKKYIE